MALYDDWKTGVTYSFSTMAPGTLPDTYEHVELNSICTYDIALKIGGSNIYAQWRKIFPLLPPGTPDTPEATIWYVFKTTSGNIIVLAADWINSPTVAAVEFAQYDIAITESDYIKMTNIRDILHKLGTKFTITERM